MAAVHDAFRINIYRQQVYLSPRFFMSFWTTRRLWTLTLLLFVLLALWDAIGLDLPLAHWFGSPQGFALRHQSLFVLLLHELPRMAAWALLAALSVGVFRPWGFLQGLGQAQRWQLVLTVIGASLTIAVFKRISDTSCPWDLAEFGGAAQYVSHWLWRVRDEGAGHCFPAGHASAAFAYLAGWFVLRRSAPDTARPWLVWVLLAGMVLGLAQQMRGAHYMSHTLWTAWLCWAWGLAVDTAVQLRWHNITANTNLNKA